MLGTIFGIIFGNITVVREQLPGSPVRTVTRTVTVTKTINPRSASPPNSTTRRYHVRRRTKSNPITLSQGYSADLDSQSPDWDVAHGTGQSDLDLNYSFALNSTARSDLAVVTGPERAETCASATAYGGVERQKLKKGISICAKTSDHRLAYLTVVAFSPSDSVTFSATVWDPPVPRSG